MKSLPVLGILAMSCALALSTPRSLGQTQPVGFVNSIAVGGFNLPVGVVFLPDGRAMVWEKAGRVWMVDGGVVSASPVLDISEEVGDWRDHGMLGLAIDPDFANTGRIYLSYAVDYHHARYFGTPQYNPATNEYFRDTIGRVTRFELNAADNFTSTVPGSRVVLIGQTLSTGIPLVHQSHGIGTLVFGEDGTLIVGTGDGASYEQMDNGGPRSGSSNTGLADGIITAAENVGSFRAQLLESLSGKLLRIDPATGDGVPSNPFYNPAVPASARSRVWALGFRNPFRFSLRPGSGNPDPAAADPGSIYLGDVGWSQIEELNVIRGPGGNYGWPLYEGMTINVAYNNANAYNAFAPNPLAGGSCPPNFLFHSLLVQETLNQAFWPNPCNTAVQVPATLNRFMHTRPAIDWGRSSPFRCGGFTSGIAAVYNVGAPGAPVSGGGFNPGGASATGGAWYTGTAFPALYQNSYYMGEFSNGWIHQIVFDADDRPVLVRQFATGLGGVVDVEYNPVDQSLYYVDIYAGNLRRISFGLNNPPVVVATPAVSFGPLPLTVGFSTVGTFDPDNDGLVYEWDFGDGSPVSNSPNPTHIYQDLAPTGQPRRFNVTLRVTDARGLRTTRTLLVSGNNTPPSATITGPVDGSLFSAAQFVLPLRATIDDAEHGPGELACRWQVTLYHNTHQHREPLIVDCAPDVLIDGISHAGEVFYWGFRLTVTDAAGLSTTAESFMYPAPVDCNGNGIDDTLDITNGNSQDCNGNLIPDECDINPAIGLSADCNGNGVPDECDTAMIVTHRFNEGPAPWQLNGAAAWIDGAIRLTPAQQTRIGSMVTTLPGGADFYTATVGFDFRIGGGTGADGLSVSFMDAGLHGAGALFGEEGPGPGALTVQFDTYDNGGEGENTVEAMLNGVTLARYTPTFDMEDDLTHRAEVTFGPRGLTVRLTSSPGEWETAFTDLPLHGWGPAARRIGFGGRTGGQTNQHWIDNVVISVPGPGDLNRNAVPDDCECRADFNGSGQVSVQDIFDFLAAYFGGTLDADFNGSGTLSVQDLFDFIEAYFGGCD